jgi:UDP-N-acetylmuramate--alanine ligase
VHIEDIRLGRQDAEFSIRYQGRQRGRFRVEAPGLLYVRNAVAALTMAHAIGIDWEVAGAGLSGYHGVARRFETRGEHGGVTFVDDYGHLPTEVADTLAAAAAGGWSRLVVVFQPHRYSRTEAMWAEFADAFVGADILLVTDVYPAGEALRPGVTGRLVLDAVRRAHPSANVRYTPALADTEAELRRVLRPGDLCLTLGAGDLTTLPDRFLAPAESVPRINADADG